MPPPPWVLIVAQLTVMLPILAIAVVIGLTVMTWSQAGALRAVTGPLLGGCAGVLVGYVAGAFVSCRWLWPGSNTCGLAAVFVTAPLAAIAGAWIGRRLLFNCHQCK
jgi:hypothetical protein